MEAIFYLFLSVALLRFQFYFVQNYILSIVHYKHLLYLCNDGCSILFVIVYLKSKNKCEKPQQLSQLLISMEHIKFNRHIYINIIGPFKNQLSHCIHVWLLIQKHCLELNKAKKMKKK